MYNDGLQDELLRATFDALLQGGVIPCTAFPELGNGIQIFPGSVPLYKDGQLVGAVGISGDGVDQDDIIAFAGSRRFRPDPAIRSDALREGEILPFLDRRLRYLDNNFTFPPDFLDRMRNNLLDKGISDVHLPYVKFPRNPDRDE